MKYHNPNKMKFLLTFFSSNLVYEVKEVNGFILVKYFSNNTHEWEVAIYTPESFKQRESYLNSVPARKLSDGEQTTMLNVVAKAQPVDHQTGSCTQKISSLLK